RLAGGRGQGVGGRAGRAGGRGALRRRGRRLPRRPPHLHPPRPAGPAVGRPSPPAAAAGLSSRKNSSRHCHFLWLLPPARGPPSGEGGRTSTRGNRTMNRLALLTVAAAAGLSGCASPARYVEKTTDSGIVAIPAPTDSWPTYNRSAAQEL